MRSLYSSTFAQCNPASGIQSYAAFEYDNTGKIIKISRDNSITTLTYNAAGLVSQQTHSNGQSNLVVNYKYDSRGNIIEEANSNGSLTSYEYDDKLNPYYLMRRRPGIMTAFYSSPNNVIRVKPATGSVIEIGFQYNAFNLPVKMFDSNGLTYNFIYQ